MAKLSNHGVPFVEAFGAFFDATSRSHKVKRRIYYFEELLVSCCFTFLSNIRPVDGNCLKVAVPMVLVAVAHTGYMGIVRPYSSKLEFAFISVHAVTALLLTFLCLVVVYTKDTNSSTDVAITYLVIVEGFIFFAHVVGMGIWAYLRERRRDIVRGAVSALKLSSSKLKIKIFSERGDSNDSDSDEEVEMKALEVPMLREEERELPQDNPLRK